MNIALPETQSNLTSLRSAVEDALNQVYDPCSVAAGHPLGLIDMGLVTNIAVTDGNVGITLRVTFAGCMMMPNLAGAAEDVVAALPGVNHVDVDVDMNMTWTPADMKPRPTPIPDPVFRGTPKLGPIGGSMKEESL